MPVAAALAASLATAQAAGAGQTIFWANSQANRISYAPIGEGHGADIPIPDEFVKGPFGLTIDAAAGRIYWASRDSNTIGYASFDGSGAGLLNTAGASVDGPSGLTIDPTAGRLYWANSNNDSISFAALNGSGGANLNTAGATVKKPNGVALDLAGKRIFWANREANAISFASLAGSGGNDLDTAGAPVEGPEGLAIDPSAGRLYWSNFDGGSIGYANLNGGGGGKADTRSVLMQPLGLAIDPAGQTIYWADQNVEQIGVANLSGAGAIPPATSGATLNGVAYPILLRSPLNLEMPAVVGKHRPGSALSCSEGKWAGDLTEAFLFRAPQSFHYQWFRNGKPVAGAATPSVVANKVGTYSCSLTAANFAGTDSELTVDFSVNATVRVRKVTFNRARGTATVRLALTGRGRLKLSGRGIAPRRKARESGTAKLLVRATGKPLRKLDANGRTTVKAKIAYTPEGGRAIRRAKTIVLKKARRR